MTEGHIFIQGIISPWQDKSAEEYGEVNIKQVTQQIQDNKDAGKLIVHIHSPGGDVDEGFGIHDILVASGKEIETRIEGLCASIATVIAMAGSVRSITENSEFMIHTPWTMVGGDADELQKNADQLQTIEDKIIDFYVTKTGAKRESIESMMKEETWLTSAQAKELGFVTEIIATMKAVALFKIKNSPNNNVMNQKELETTIDNKLNTFLNKFKDIFKVKNAVTITTADGTVLDFGSQAETAEDVKVGMTATIEGGGEPDGEYVMKDGGTWVFVAGELTEMKEAEEDDVAALKQKIADLEAELSAAKAENQTMKDSVEEIQKEVVTMKAQIKSDITSFAPGSVEPGKQNGAGEENRFANLKIKTA